jgi:hypothetical protein
MDAEVVDQRNRPNDNDDESTGLSDQPNSIELGNITTTTWNSAILSKAIQSFRLSSVWTRISRVSMTLISYRERVQSDSKESVGWILGDVVCDVFALAQPLEL